MASENFVFELQAGPFHSVDVMSMKLEQRLGLVTEAHIVALAAGRLRRLAAHGSTTIEVKSGYGLSLDSELRTLRVIRALAAELPVRLVPTFLGAHEVPLEYREAPRTRTEYIDLLVNEMLPAVASEKLAAFCDIFCEPGVYTTDESRRVLNAARTVLISPRLPLLSD